MKTRPALFAGSWYPASANACTQEIRSFLGDNPSETKTGNAIGGIVPHAGWYFSGKIACNVIHRLVNTDTSDVAPDVIAIFGMHLHPESPCYIMAEGAWETPFGPLPVHSALADALISRFPFNIETPGHYTRDNTVELQLPFVKYFFPKTHVLTMGLPPLESSLDVARATANLAAEMGLTIKVIGSTDLTHYGTSYGFTPMGPGPSALKWACDDNDRRIIDAMQSMVPADVIRQALTHHNACCAGAAAGAIAAARAMGATRAETVAYATSYDKSPGDSFVGYVGMVFS
ncbi:MAG: AmmeMemoRadiSam system protein B [Deltaproteobacteria bacterium]|nr:MAG: AmmeMemoRadiSam system protein B [Deltaproteobacteria bacterium]